MITNAESIALVFVAVVLGAIYCIETGFACASGASAGQDPVAQAATAPDPELVELMKARKEALNKRLEYVQAQEQVGAGLALRHQRQFANCKDAELDLATTDEERIAALEANLQRLQNLESEATIRGEVGLLRPEDYLLTIANRRGGEIELRKAKRK